MTKHKDAAQIEILTGFADNVNGNIGGYLRGCRPDEDLDAGLLKRYAKELDSMPAYFTPHGGTWYFSERGKNLFDMLYDRGHPFSEDASLRTIPELHRRPVNADARGLDERVPIDSRKSRHVSDGLDEVQYDAFRAFVRFIAGPEKPELLDYMKRIGPGKPFDDEVTRVYGKDFKAMSNYFGVDEDGNISFGRHGKKVFEGELMLQEGRKGN
ncbi:MAG: hypothetical protein V1887_00290 [Candidatus Aenigmatarchaeota archaeon]